VSTGNRAAAYASPVGRNRRQAFTADASHNVTSTMCLCLCWQTSARVSRRDVEPSPFQLRSVCVIFQLVLFGCFAVGSLLVMSSILMCRHTIQMCVFTTSLPLSLCVFLSLSVSLCIFLSLSVSLVSMCHVSHDLQPPPALLFYLIISEQFPFLPPLLVSSNCSCLTRTRTSGSPARSSRPCCARRWACAIST